jgi:hypothetical protein
MEWSIPAVGNGYSVSQDAGVLNVREEIDVRVSFTPLELGKYPGDFMVESQGRYKIVSVSGVGGLFDIRMEPKGGVVLFGKTPCGTFTSQQLLVHNQGGVGVDLKCAFPKNEIYPARMRVVHPIEFDDSCDTKTTDVVYLGPNQTLGIVFQVDPGPGPLPFQFSGKLTCHEAEFPVKLEGEGVVIELKQKTKHMLATENLTVLSIIDP